MMATDDLACRDFVELVTEFLEGSLSAAQRARLEAHLAECDDCGDYLEQMRQTIRTLGALAKAPLAPDVRAHLLALFRDWKLTAGSAGAT